MVVVVGCDHREEGEDEMTVNSVGATGGAYRGYLSAALNQ